ncbi:MAG: YqaA family protein [archaeon]
MSIFADLMVWTTNTFGPMGMWGLFILSFIESSFFPIPPDVLLIILTLEQPHMWWLLAIVCTIGSMLGGMFGYLIGYLGEEALLRRLVKPKRIEKVHKLFNRYEAWAIFIAGFTPIPYKVFSVSAGVFYIDFKRFVLATFFSRGLRFFIVALVIRLFGPPVVGFIEKYFNILSLVGVVVVVLGYVGYRWYKKRKNSKGKKPDGSDKSKRKRTSKERKPRTGR